MNYIQRLHVALDNDAETVSVLAHLPVAKLDNKLALINKQVGSAKKFEQFDALEVLKVWADQISNAKELKRDLCLEDNDLLDVDMQLTELAAFEMIEKRQDILKEKLLMDEMVQNSKR